MKNRWLIASYLLLVLLWLGSPVRAEDKPTVIRVAVPGVGIGNRPVVGGSSWAVVHLRGLLEDEFTALGLPPEHFTHRGSVTNDYLRAMKEAWLNTGPSWYQGRYVRFTDAGTFPHPVRQPHIPIWAGGKGEQVLIRAARLCNGYIAIASDPPALREEVAQLRRCAESDRRDPAELTIAMTGGITVTKTPAEAVGLGDRGEIAPGKRADLIRVRLAHDVPAVRSAWSAGRRVA